MKLVNIYNKRRIIYKFLRDDEGNQIVEQDNSFFPYFFEPYEKGKFKGYDGTNLKKIFCSEPSEVKERRSDMSCEADIIYTRRYMIDRVPSLEPAPIRYMFLDIEVLTRELPDYKNPVAPISCISVYDSFDDKIYTWYMGDIEGDLKTKEQYVLNGFLHYIKAAKPDLFLAWNVAFDYNYLHARHDRFAQAISPIGRVRLGDYDNQIFYPAGISILDYLLLFKKVHMREQSYALDHIAQVHLDEETFGETKFDKLDPIIKEKNINDVVRMVKLERRYKLISYFNEIRCLSKCQWEDFCVKLKGMAVSGNSRVVEMLLFDEAKKVNVILPNKQYGNEKEEFEGAYRDVFAKGVHKNISKYDLSSAYPNMIKDFCLDTINIREELKPGANNLVNVNNVNFYQDQNALLPKIIDRLITLKTQRKKELKGAKFGTDEGEDAQRKYDAAKALLNSAYGVMGNRFFRIYDNRVAAATTFLVRDVLHYVQDKLEAEGIKVLYVDTDSVFVDLKKDISEKLNNFITDWGMQYGKDSITTQFEYEGYFERLLLLTKCRYFGELRTPKGLKEEIKGLEVKRGDSTKFMAQFQRELIGKFLDKETYPKIRYWIHKEIKRMKKLPIEEIAFPCKVNKKKETYKNIPIFIRALENTQDLVEFDKVPGDLFYYIYIEPKFKGTELVFEYYEMGKSEKTDRVVQKRKLKVDEIEEANEYLQAQSKLAEDKIDKYPKFRKVERERKIMLNVLAFDKTVKDHVKNIDWNKMIERNVINKVEVLFEALGWEDKMEKLKGGLINDGGNKDE